MNYNIRALLSATFASILMIVLVFFGSRNLQNFDAALITYLFGTVFCFFLVLYIEQPFGYKGHQLGCTSKEEYTFYLQVRCFHLVFVSKEVVGNIVYKNLFILEENTDG